MAFHKEKRFRLRNGQNVVGYMRKINNKSTFYSKDSFWWSGRCISYSEIDEWTGYRDRNRKLIFEWDILKFKLDPDDEPKNGVVLWQEDRSRFVIRNLDDNFYCPFEMDGLQMFQTDDLKVFSYLFLNPDIIRELGLEEE